MTHVTKNTGNNEWYTPKIYVDAASTVMGGIDLDPATSVLANATVKAGTIYTATDNGLTKIWAGRIWLNPPYDRWLLPRFADKLVASYLAGNCEAIVLTNNTTETKVGQMLLVNCTGVCFPDRRIKYVSPKNMNINVPIQGQMFTYFGPNGAKFATVFGEFGVVFLK